MSSSLPIQGNLPNSRTLISFIPSSAAVTSSVVSAVPESLDDIISTVSSLPPHSIGRGANCLDGTSLPENSCLTRSIQPVCSSPLFSNQIYPSLTTVAPSLPPASGQSGLLTTWSAAQSTSPVGLTQPSTQQPVHHSKSSSRHNKKSKSVPTSQELSTTFLQRELSSAQTRITQLDASIEEKERRIAILLARVKILEDRDNENTYNKYFPDSSSKSPSNTSIGVNGVKNCR